MKTNVHKNDPRRLAVEGLVRWLGGSVTVDVLRDELLVGRDEMDPRDRALFNEILYGVVRHRDALTAELNRMVDAGVEKMQHRLLAILLVGTYQVIHLDRVPGHAIVNGSVELAKAAYDDRAAGMVNAVLRRALFEQDRRPVDGFYTDRNPLNGWRNFWRTQWGEEKTDQLIAHYERIPPFGVRRNLLRTESDEAWLALLREEGLDPVTVEGFPGFAYIKGVKLDELPSFQQGLTTAQDPAASLAVRLLDPQPGERVLDLCSAPGGKAALIFEMMGGEGQLVAVDRSMKRNRLMREAMKRLGHDQIEVFTQDAMLYDEGGYDRVLLDAPCSGTGVAHRRPDLLTRRRPARIDELTKLQKRLIEHAAKLVKPGGVLVYSTCSLEPLENEKRATIFEKKEGASFERLPAEGEVPEETVREDGAVGTWPPRDGVDGAYAVRWRRLP